MAGSSFCECRYDQFNSLFKLSEGWLAFGIQQSMTTLLKDAAALSVFGRTSRRVAALAYFGLVAEYHTFS
jgi:hypothetical protein